MGAIGLSLLSSPRLWLVTVLAGAAALVGIQSARLSHAKADLTVARAALIDPASRRPWSDEARSSAAALAICQTNTAHQSEALTQQSAAVTGLAAEGAADSAKAQAAVRQARDAAGRALAKAQSLLATAPEPSSACAADGADALILGSLTP